MESEPGGKPGRRKKRHKAYEKVCESPPAVFEDVTKEGLGPEKRLGPDDPYGFYAACVDQVLGGSEDEGSWTMAQKREAAALRWWLAQDGGERSQEKAELWRKRKGNFLQLLPQELWGRY